MERSGLKQLDETFVRRRILAVALGLAGLLLMAETSAIPHGITLGLYQGQDRLAALVHLGAFALVLLLPAWHFRRTIPELTLARTIAFALLLSLVLWAGTHAVLANYAFTRDEQMAVFDAALLREGWLAAPVPPEWRSLVPAMAPLFLLPAEGNAAWVSAYLPGNPILRAGLSLIADPALLNPLLAALGGILLFLIGRRLFPKSRSAVGVALLLYLTSAQMVVAAMTPFAMTAHMTFNLLWLTFFLRGGRSGHASAAMVGFFATGLHQIVFHPLFALPFLDHLRRQGEWRTAIFYVFVYLAAGFFWMAYQSLALASVGAQGAAGGGAGFATFITDRVLPLIVSRDLATLPLTAFNSLRFAMWQNLALLPLCLCAFPAIRRAEGIARPLFLGILLTFAAMVFLLPYQSIGWGYRYLHGLLGSFALLAAYGWCEVAAVELKRRLLAVGTAIAVFATGPWLVWQTHRLIAPAVEVDAAISQIDADFVIIDAPGFAMDQVRNDPFLRNRPLRFAAQRLGDADVDALCARGKVAFVAREEMVARGLGAMGEADPSRLGAIRKRLAGRPCV